jgi:UDP-N-acetylglucosamine--N-acetylmuramyl-(pentapeptide) pyrophosphoryl-undecaprenol N-acetylglucosamine transferase
MNDNTIHDTIWYIGGTSGGHIFPLINLIKKSNNRSRLFLPDLVYIHHITSDYTGNKTFFNYTKSPLAMIWIPVFIVKTFFYVILLSFRQWQEKPVKIVSTGGFFCLPFFIVSKIFLIPFDLYHLDSIPGKAALLVSKIGHIRSPIYEYYIYENAIRYCNKKNFILKTRYPIRFDTDDKIDQKEARKKLGIEDPRYIIFVLGGSQGAHSLNTIILHALGQMKNTETLYVIHQTGKTNKQEIEKAYKEQQIQGYIFDFQINIADYYNAADLIISRCGAGTLEEIFFFNKKAILVPLRNVPHDHQLENAIALCKQDHNKYIVTTEKDAQKEIINYINSRLKTS